MTLPNTKRPPRKKFLVLAIATFAITGLGIFVLAPLTDTVARRQIRFDGFLRDRDLAAIRRIVRLESWRGFPSFSASSLREFFETEIRARWSEHIGQISVNADGTVEVETVVQVKWPIEFSHGAIYIFQKGQGGWHIISRGGWES